MRIFEEKQRFTQTWLIVLLAITNSIVFIIVFKAFLDEKMGVINFISVISFILIASGFIFILELKTRIDELGIHYQFFPFHLTLKTIPWKDMEQVKVRNYNAISEFGGWGLKGGFLWKKKNGIAITIKGHVGIQVITNAGKKILIGTQKREAVTRILTRYLNNN